MNFLRQYFKLTYRTLLVRRLSSPAVEPEIIVPKFPAYAAANSIKRTLIKQMASSFYKENVLYVWADDKKKIKVVKLIFLYPASNGERKLLEFVRDSNLFLQATFERMAIKLNVICSIADGKPKSKKSKKAKTDGEIVNLFPLDVFSVKDEQGNALNPQEVMNSTAFQEEGKTFHIGDQSFVIQNRLPYIVKMKLELRMFVGYPMMPSVRMVDGDIKHSQFFWFVETHRDSSVSVNADSITTNLHDIGDKQATIEGFSLKSKEFFYVPSEEDVGKRLCLAVVPGNESYLGVPSINVSHLVVEKLPVDDEMVYSEQHRMCSEEKVPSDALRIVDYNVLANLYMDLDRKEQHELYFPYCLKEYLQLDYRYPILLKSILGFNGDVICVQEAETKLWIRYLEPYMSLKGYKGLFGRKGAEVDEGSATFYKPEKLDFIDSFNVILSDLVKDGGAPWYEDVSSVCNQNPEVAEMFITRPAVLQVSAFRSLVVPNRIVIVCSTHFHFHCNHGHIRLLQAVVCQRHIQKLVEKFQNENKNSKVGVIFCGDLNSQPDFEQVYKMLTTGRLSSDDSAWSSGSTNEIPFKGVEVDSPLKLRSACDPKDYTTYLGIGRFKGCLDYIFFSDDVFDVRRSFPMPSNELIEKYGGLPSKISPSDHLPLICDLQFR